MKSVGKWVVVKSDETESKFGIISQNDTIGVVVDCAYNEDLVGRKVFFSVQNAKKNEGFLFVPYDDIYGYSKVME